MREQTQALLEQLKQYPIFDLTTIARRVPLSPSSLRLFVHRLAQKKRILRIEKNKYTVLKDPWLVAAHLLWPCYITSWAALRYHNLTEQLPNTLEVVTSRSRRKRDFSILGMNIHIITTTPRLYFGFAKLLRHEQELFMAEPEKALLDAALWKRISLTEISGIIKERRSQLRSEKLVRYLLTINNKSLSKRFGYLLEQVGKDYYPRLQRQIDHNYILLDYSLPQRGKKNIKWRIIDNVTKR